MQKTNFCACAANGNRMREMQNEFYPIWIQNRQIFPAVRLTNRTAPFEPICFVGTSNETVEKCKILFILTEWRHQFEPCKMTWKIMVFLMNVLDNGYGKWMLVENEKVAVLIFGVSLFTATTIILPWLWVKWVDLLKDPDAFMKWISGDLWVLFSTVQTRIQSKTKLYSMKQSVICLYSYRKLCRDVEKTAVQKICCVRSINGLFLCLPLTLFCYI